MTKWYVCEQGKLFYSDEDAQLGEELDDAVFHGKQGVVATSADAEPRECGYRPGELVTFSPPRFDTAAFT